MKVRAKWWCWGVGLSASLLSGCVGLRAAQVAAPLKIENVYIAQQHVQEPESPYFRLVGKKGALIKVHVYSETHRRSPFVVAILKRGGREMTLPLQGPEFLPKRPKGEPIEWRQAFSDCFTGYMPKTWVKQGLSVSVELRQYDYHPDGEQMGVMVADRYDAGVLPVGAPSEVVMTQFDVHFFGQGQGADYPEGWEQELFMKLPLANLEVRRVRTLMFNELVMPPRGEKPAIRCTSEADYREQSGMRFDGEQGISLKWMRALKRAEGLYGVWRHYYINIAGVPAGGQGGGFGGVGSLHRHGILIHELGHTFRLPHWAHRKSYPYTRANYIDPEAKSTNPNAGPVWGFDLHRRRFISPRVQKDAVGREPGEWKRIPMAGGGTGDQEPDFMFRYFPDYAVHRIQQFLERALVVWNDELNAYARWDQEKWAYVDVIENDGLLFPEEHDVPVISLLVTASAVTPEANIIYQPIGPYKAGLIKRFDAESAKSRAEAKAIGGRGKRYADSNVCLRVLQGGKQRTYLLPITISEDDDPLQHASFNVEALNLPARDGEVTGVELLWVPALMERGLDGDVKRLTTWSAEN